MQSVILCAGKGTRLRPLTNTTPKPMILVAGKPVLQHIVEALPPEIDEIILVVGYLQEQIRAFCGDEFLGRRVHYVEQADFAGGTAEALWQTKDLITGTFMHLNGDDIHGAPALQTAVRCKQAVIGAHSETPERFGVFELNDDGSFKSIVEKPEIPPSHLINTGGYVFDPKVFDYFAKVDTSDPDCLVKIVTEFAADYPMAVIEQNQWLPIGYPEHIAAAEAVLLKSQ